MEVKHHNCTMKTVDNVITNSIVEQFFRVLGVFAELRKATVSFISGCPSVCMEHLDSQWMNSYDLRYFSIFANLSRKFRLSSLARMTGTLHDRRTFLISRSIRLRVRTVSDKSCREIQNTFDVPKLFPPKIMRFITTWKNRVQPRGHR